MHKFMNLLLIGLILGCHQSGEPQPVKFKPDPIHTNVSTDLNGVDLKSQYDAAGWHLVVDVTASSGGTATCMQPGLDIQINQYSKYGTWYSNLSFWISQDINYDVIPLKRADLCPPFVSFSTLEGDAGTGTFRLVDSKTNQIQIDSYNKVTGEISGRFQCYFVPYGDNKYSFLKNVDTLRFTNGYFKTVVMKQL